MQRNHDPYSLDQMDLDRKDDDNGDYLNYGQTIGGGSKMDIQLSQTDHKMMKTNTVGGRMWSPDKKKEQEPIGVNMDDLREEDDLEEIEQIPSSSVAYYNP